MQDSSYNVIRDVERQPWIRGQFKLEASSVLDFTANPSVKGASSESGFSVWFSGTAASPTGDQTGIRTGTTFSYLQPSLEIIISGLGYVSTHHLVPGLPSSLAKEDIPEKSR